MSVVEAVASLKKQYQKIHPKGDGWPPPCISATCIKLATRRVHWPGTLPAEEFPVYCDSCATMARQIIEILGHKYFDEPLPPPPGERPTRALVVPGAEGKIR